MKAENQENLNDLLKSFMDAEKADKAAKDFREVDNLFSKYASAEPGAELLAGIKDNIAKELTSNKADKGVSVFKTAMLRFATVAAVFVIFVSVWLANNSINHSDIPRPNVANVSKAGLASSVWESDDFTSNDSEYETFEREIEQIESEIVATKYETDSYISGETELTEIENDFIEIQSEFWKG